MIALNFRVRDGIGCFANTMITGPVKVCQTSVCSMSTLYWVCMVFRMSLAVSGWIKPIGRLVPVSTRITALTPLAYRRGGLPRP